MVVYGVLGLFLLTILVVGVGMVALRRLAGWWLVVLATGLGVVSAASAVTSAARGSDVWTRTAWSLVPGLLGSVAMLAAALAGAWTWRRGVPQGGPLVPRRWQSSLEGRDVLVWLGAPLLVVLLAVGLLAHAPLLDLVVQVLVTLALVCLAERRRRGFTLLLGAQVVTILQVLGAALAYRDYFTTAGLLGGLAPSLLQVVALSAVALWGLRLWRATPRPGGRSSSAPEGHRAGVR